MAGLGRKTCLTRNICSILVVIVLCQLLFVQCKKDKEYNEEEKWKKKDVTDYNDADLERLYEQWEDADDEPLPEDELPEWKRPQPKIDMSKIDPNDPEGMLKMTKKGKTIMIFASVAGNPTEKQTEEISMLWQSSLHNANVDVQRYVVGSNRVLFVVKDGALAFDVKEFLMTKDNCEVVTIEGKDFHNPNSQKNPNNNRTAKKPKSEKKSEKKKSDKKKKAKKDKKKDEEKIIRQNIENEINKNLDKTEL